VLSSSLISGLGQGTAARPHRWALKIGRASNQIGKVCRGGAVNGRHGQLRNRLLFITAISYSGGSCLPLLIQSGKMAWSAPDGLLSLLLSGDPLAILIAFIFAISLPILVHSFLYRASDKSATTPTFLLLGTSGAGKTSLLTLVRLLICNSCRY